MSVARLSPARRRSGRTRFRVVAGFLLIGLGLWVLVERHFDNLDYFVVTSESMEPTLHIGDRVVMERTTAYHPGDIIVFEDPADSTKLVVKRILALPGSRVLAQGDDLAVNQPPTATTANGRTWQIEPGEVFVAGDNRPVSRDSRDYGPIPLESIRGRVCYRILSRLHWEKVK